MKSAELMQWLATVSELTHHQRKQLEKVLKQQSDELKVLELIETSFEAKNACPCCGGVKLYRHGVVNGLQRYYCRQCQKTFNALTETPLARLRDKAKRLDYLAAMAGIQDCSTVRCRCWHTPQYEFPLETSFLVLDESRPS